LSPIPKFLFDFGLLPRRRSVPPLARFLLRVARMRDPRKKQRLAESYFARACQHGLPLIESTGGRGAQPGFGHAVFLYRGSEQKVALWCDLPSPQPNDFTRISGTDLHYFTRELELDARMDYKFILDGGPWVLDPANPRTTEGAFGVSSQFWMPEYTPPDIEHRDNIPHGTIEELEWESELLANSRPVKIYLPPGYAHASPGAAAADARYASLYVHDGLDYLNFAKIANILDNGIAARRFPPLIAVLIPPVEREKEYDANETFARAIVEELVPLVDENFCTRRDPAHRATLGASMGGLCAVHLAGAHPDVFGNAAGQSSAFFVESPLANVCLNLDTDTPPKPVRLHLDVGAYERYYHKDLLSGNRKFADAIRRKGYPLQYREVHEGHSWGSWRARIAPALAFFWGKT
jgi:enterochelin esterase family protein